MSQSVFQLIPLNKIDPSPDNPRDDWERQQIGNLAMSIKATDGLLQPLVVRPDPEAPDRFRIVCGERRYRAAKKAKRASVECLVRQCNGLTALELTLQENLNRKDLSPLQIAKILRVLATPVKAGGAGLRDSEVAGRFGKSVAWVRNTRRILNLPDHWQAKIASGEMAPSTVRVLVPFADDEAFLAKVEADMRANPAFYRTREEMTRSIELLKNEEAAPPQPSKRALPASVGAASRRSPAAAGDDQHQPIDDLAQPSIDQPSTSAAGEASLADRAVALIEGIDTLEELNKIQRVLNRVRQRVHQVTRAKAG